MVKLLVAFPAALTAMAVVAHAEQSSSTLSASSSCPSTLPLHTDVDAALDLYHSDDVCDRPAFNAFKDELPLMEHRQYLQATGQHANVPLSHTVTCPLVGASPPPSLYQPGQATGFDATWIVENTAATPVAIAWVDPESGIEYSARNPDLLLIQDLESMLLPGDWVALQTFEGHVFHVRRLEDDGSLGPIVLQHRAGLVPVTGDCGVEDVHTVVAPEQRIPNDEDSSPEVWENEYDNEDAEDDEFQRTPAQTQGRRCNRLEVGFRNQAACPLLGYFVEPETCEEEFKFHLGGTSSKTAWQGQDFMHDWDSPTKFESSFIGQTFVFRHAVTGRPVSRITLAPTSIVDCPDNTATSRATALPVQQAVLTATGQSLPLNSSALEMLEVLGSSAAAAAAAAATNATTRSVPPTRWVASSFVGAHTR